MSDMFLRINPEDLINNPTSRIAVTLCLDVSWSMRGERIDELNAGVEEFFRECREHPQAAMSVELAIVEFAETARPIMDFQSLANIPHPPKLEAKREKTDLGTGVDVALQMLERRKIDYKNTGVDYYQPWLVIMTDGHPTTMEHTRIAPMCREMEERKKLTVFPLAIGPTASLDILSTFSIKDALRLKGLEFKAFFKWLAKSSQAVSESLPGDKVQLPPPEQQWFEIQL